MRTSFVGVDAHIDPADCTVFTVICGECATSRRADVGIGPYRVLREFTAAHRADRGVRPYGGYKGYGRRADVGIGPYGGLQEVRWAGDRKGRPYGGVTRGAVR